MLKRLGKEFSKYVIGFLFFGLIVLIVYIIRGFTLSNAEIGLIAALLGGAIGGALTLIGVQVTIDNQNREKFIDLYPKRKLNLDEQLGEMNNIIRFIEDNVGNENGNVSYSEFEMKHKQKCDEFYAYIEKATIINGQVYSISKKFQKHLIEIKECIGPKLRSIDEFTGEKVLIGNCILSEKQEDYNVNLKNLKKYYQEINMQMDSYDQKYEKLTGI